MAVCAQTALLLRSLKFAARCFSTATPARNDFKLVNHSDDGGVHHVLLDSPKTRNALSLDMLKELIGAFETINRTPDARCVLLSASGHVFSAGHNLKELTREKPVNHHQLVFSTCSSLMKLMVDCPIPIVAKVDGVAAAAGCQLVSMCDIVMASSKSTFSTPGVNLGLFCSTPGVAVARSVPMKTAAYLLYTGMPITADEALRAGLVSRVVDSSHLDNETQKVVESIRGKSRPVVRLGKEFLYRQIKMDNIMEAYENGERVMVDNLQLEDAQEGLRSFAEKRKPNFTDN